MSLETLALALRRVFESPWLGCGLEVAWHGGEPLTVPLGWYEQAFELIARLKPPALRLRHRFQTNGLLLDENWLAFLAETGARIGLSVDGPADLHDACRRTRRGFGTHERAMRAIELLRARALKFHVITVLTERALDDPERLFDFYAENGIEEVGFNIEEIEGDHLNSSLLRSGAERKLRHFFKRLFDLSWDRPGVLKVREFESAIGHLLSDHPILDEQNIPFAVLNIAHDGAMSTFSPELLGARHPRFETFALGHVATHRLTDIVDQPGFRALNNEIRDGVRACEKSCRYFRWCGGGAPANKLFETGGFDGAETMHCRLTRQAIIDEVISGIEERIREPRIKRQEIRAHRIS